MNNNQIEQAKTSLFQLLSILKINQTVFVDDSFENEPNQETVIGWLSESVDELPAQLTEQFGDINFSDPNVWKRQFRDLWNRLDADKHIEIALLISSVLNKSIQEQKIDDSLSQLFDKQITFLSPTEWNEKRKDILSKISVDNRMLCIFDQDLSLSTGFSSEGGKSGIGLIKELIESHDENVICCLLSRKIPSNDNELTYWYELAEENALSLKDFIPLAKFRLENDSSPYLFVDGIKKALLNQYFESLKQITTDMISESTSLSITDFKNIDPYDFDLMVLVASKLEGNWEIESLLRLFEIFHQDQLSKLLFNPANLKEINHNVNIAREISSVKLSDEVVYDFPQVKPLRRRELYQSGTLIYQTPLEVGDIFETTSAKTRFILLAQPCDLMVREIGTRRVENYFVPLVPIIFIPKNEIDTKEKDYWVKSALLPNYSEDYSFVAIVDFTKTVLACIDFLDISVINPTGDCQIDLKKEVVIPDHLTIGWQKRLRNVIAKYERHQKQLDEFQVHLAKIKHEEVKKKIWLSTMPKVWTKDFGASEFPYNDGGFDYGIRRIERYRKSGAVRLLKTYTYYLSRDADEFDFAKLVDETTIKKQD